MAQEGSWRGLIEEGRRAEQGRDSVTKTDFPEREKFFYYVLISDLCLILWLSSVTRVPRYYNI